MRDDNDDSTRSLGPNDQPTEPLLPAPPTPDHIGPYKILEVLGEGGMGIVYLAEQEKPLQRRVALKLIKLGMDTQQVIARFESERQVLALMNHPNVARVFDAGSTEQGRLYFVMEHVPGIPVTEYCDQQKLTNRQRLELFIPVCEAIQHAHQKGIIHRDIKPSNVLVALADGKPVPKVIDFGVAKATGQQLTERTHFTRRGVLVGTPEYMSPEQAGTTGLDVDTRTDIYSLGVLLYELLVGALPFDSRRLRQAALDELLRIIREEEPSRPSARVGSLGDVATSCADRRKTDSRTLTKQLRGELDWITMKALDKDRARRYSSPQEFATDVRSYLSRLPVSAAPPTIRYRFAKFVARHKVPLVAASSFVLLIAAGFAISTFLYLQAEGARQLAEDRRLEAEEQTARATTAQRLAEESRAEAERQRVRAEGLYNQAELARREAITERDNATRSRAEAEWQSYLANVRAAELYLDKGETGYAKELLHACPTNFRGWEWLHLDFQADSSVTTFRVQEASTVGWAFGRDAVVSASDATLAVWNLDTMTTDAAIDVGKKIDAIAIDTDGDRIAVVTVDGVTLWDRDLARSTLPFSHGREVYRTVAFARDGALLVAGSSGGMAGNAVEVSPKYLNARIWDIQSYELIQTLPGTGMAWADDLAVSVNGDLLATSDFLTDDLVIWNVANGDKLATVPGGISSSFSPDGKSIIASSSTLGLRAYDASSGQVQWTVTDDDFGVITHDLTGERVAVATSTKQIQIRRSSDGRLISRHYGHDHSVLGLAFASRDRLYSGDSGGILKLWSLKRSHESVLMDEAYLTAVAYSRDGSFLAAGAKSEPEGHMCSASVWIWNIKEDLPPRKLCEPSDAGGMVLNVDFSPDGSALVVGSTRSRATIWNVRELRRLQVLEHDVPTQPPAMPGHGSVRALFTVDGRSIVTGDSNGVVRLWSAESGELLRELASHQARVVSLAVSPDGSSIASADSGGVIRVTTVDSGTSLGVAIDDEPFLGSIAYSPAGSRLAAVDSRSRVHIWDSDSGQLIERFNGLRNCRWIVFSPDGRRLVAASPQGTIGIWDTRSYDRLMTIDIPFRQSSGGESNLITFSPSGSALTTVIDGNLRVFRTQMD